jgi:hypothetical protein
MLIDPSDQALLDSTGIVRQAARRSGAAQPTHGNNGGRLVQPYCPISAVSSPAHATGPAITGAVTSSTHTARPASARAAFSSAHTARPASKINPAEAKAAYSRLLEEFPVVACSSISDYRRSGTMLCTTSSHSGRPSLPTGKRKVGGGKGEVQAAERKRHNPVVNNSAFVGISPEGAMAQLSKCVEGISHYDAMGELAVAPDRALQPGVDQLKRLVFPAQSYPTSPDPGTAQEGGCQSSQRDRQHGACLWSAEAAFASGWAADQVHPSTHVYAKMALNLLKRISAAKR